MVTQRTMHRTLVRLRSTWTGSSPLLTAVSISCLAISILFSAPVLAAQSSTHQLMQNIVRNQSTDYYDELTVKQLRSEATPEEQLLTTQTHDELQGNVTAAEVEKLIALIGQDIAAKKKRNAEAVAAAAKTMLTSYKDVIDVKRGDLGANLTISKSAKAASAINEFPPDFMSDRVRQKGGFIVHILIFVYLSLALAVICDNYFLKSLEFISDALNIPADIAGATFMAIGTSAPELFTSVIGVFVSDNDIGTGTIVGSAVFNLIAIPGACGFAAYYNLKVMPKITAFPIVRDTIFYVLTIITLILCIKDNQVDWIESIVLLCLYGIYIILMYFNAQVSNLLQKDSKKYIRDSMGSPSSVEEKLARKANRSSKSKKCCCRTPSLELSGSETEIPYEQQPLLLKDDPSRISPPPAYQATGQTHHHHHHRVHSKPSRSKSHADSAIIPSAPQIGSELLPMDYSKIQLAHSENGKFKEVPSSVSPSHGTPSPEPDLDYEAIHRALASSGPKVYDLERNLHQNGKRSKAIKRSSDAAYEPLIDDEPDAEWTDNIIIKILLFPFTILFCFTLPKPSRYCFVLTFLSSIFWIAALTYLIVWMVTLVGFTLGIPDTVSGITILAAGTSIPELISSYLIVKKAGLADMAICNSIGSNIFDILFCLGLPWLLKTLVLIVTNGASFATLAAASIPIQSTALPLTSLTLLLTIGAMLAIFKISNWRLSLQTGILCTIVYVIFVISSTMLELHV